MNIFVLDTDPVKAAQLQCNKHVIKMLLESAQMLSTAHRMLDGVITSVPSKSGKRMSKAYVLPLYRENELYRAVHYNHPCTQWTMQTLANYEWHYKHFVALCDEYTYRYGKVHMTDSKLRTILMNPPNNIKIGPQTPFALAMGSNPECMHKDDPVRSYREFYQTKQDRFAMVWTNRNVPEWFHVKQEMEAA